MNFLRELRWHEQSVSCCCGYHRALVRIDVGGYRGDLRLQSKADTRQAAFTTKDEDRTTSVYDYYLDEYRIKLRPGNANNHSSPTSSSAGDSISLNRLPLEHAALQQSRLFAGVIFRPGGAATKGYAVTGAYAANSWPRKANQRLLVYNGCIHRLQQAQGGMAGLVNESGCTHWIPIVSGSCGALADRPG